MSFRKVWLAALVLVVASAAAEAGWLSFGGKKRSSSGGKTKLEDEAFTGASELFQKTRDEDNKTAVVEAYESFLRRFPESLRTADANFMAGEGYMEQALAVLKAEATAKKASSARLLAPKNPAAVVALENAAKAFERVVGDDRSGLAACAQYRLGEVAYDDKEWDLAVERFQAVEKDHPQSFLVPEAMLAIVYSNLALEKFSDAEQNLFLLGEAYPIFRKEPAVLYAQGIVALHKGDYSNAEKSLKLVKTAEAQFYLGKTYLLSKRAFLAAAAFEQLIRDYPKSDLKEEAQFFIGDSFFLAEDYTGAISKYQKFISLYPDSPLRVSALFRIGSSYFQKKDYVEARAHFQSVLDRYPKDFFAPLAQYFIAESHLIAGQVRDALFAYTKVITQYPETIKVSPLAHFKLAWTQLQVGDFAQAVTTCNNFLALYPSNALAKNVYLIQGNALIPIKRHTEAVAAFQRIIDIAPSSEVAEQALFSILQTQYNLKSYNSIVTSYQFIFRTLPPSKSRWRSLSYLYAAEAYLALNQVDEAKVIFEMVRKVYPDEPAAFYAQDGLAWCYAMRGEDHRALEERKKLQDMLAVAASTFTFSGTNELGIADSMFNQKNYDEAFQLYEKFAGENPSAAEAPGALYRAGQSLYHLRYYTQAIDTWRKLKERFPQSKETGLAVFQMADTLFRAQKYPEAVAAYKEIVAQYPQSPKLPMAMLRVAQSHFNGKDDAGTLREGEALIGRFPEAPEMTDALDLMEGVFDRSKTSDFRQVLGAIIRANPGTRAAGDAQFRLARRCFEAKDYPGAAREFQAFSVDFTNHPDLGKAQFFLGESFFYNGNHAEAAPAFERMLNNFDKGDDTPLALFHLGSAYVSLKKYDDAIRYYTRLIEEYPGSEYVKPSQFNLALSYKSLGKLDMAQYAYQRYVEAAGTSEKSSQDALWEIFSIQKDRKDYASALLTLEEIRDGSKSDSDSPIEAIYRMGEIYQLTGRHEDARKAFESIRSMRPANNPFRLQALVKLGESYEKASDYDRAAAAYEDLSRSAGQPVAGQAAQKAAHLRKMKPVKRESQRGETMVDSEQAPGERRTAAPGAAGTEGGRLEDSRPRRPKAGAPSVRPTRTAEPDLEPELGQAPADEEQPSKPVKPGKPGKRGKAGKPAKPAPGASGLPERPAAPGERRTAAPEPEAAAEEGGDTMVEGGGRPRTGRRGAQQPVVAEPEPEHGETMIDTDRTAEPPKPAPKPAPAKKKPSGRSKVMELPGMGATEDIQ
ncbi:MAG: tetratricopeptide repeat protein [Elusimicrobia bacterium]|nr:tetratricopeptide repeat protein [Elusimicrobiota bacterium]